MNKKLFIFLGIFVLGFLLGHVFWWQKNTKKYKPLYINHNVFLVEIADTPQLQEKGLSSRKYLPKNAGMLFLFPKPDFYRFWMKEMNFPLDLLWIRGKKIVEITENVPPPSLGFFYLKTYSPQVPVDKVLELNAGTVKTYGIKIGDKIKL